MVILDTMDPVPVDVRIASFPLAAMFNVDLSELHCMPFSSELLAPPKPTVYV